MKVKVHSAKEVPDQDDQDGLKLLVDWARTAAVLGLKHLWLDAGYQGREGGREGQEVGGGGSRLERGSRAKATEARPGGGGEDLGC